MLYCGVAASDDSDYNEARDAMINAINQDARYTGFLTKRQQLDEHVMAAMKKVPRHRFVAPDLVDVAYENRPLPIGHGQTISQPYIVALMTDLLNVNKDDVVLEVGTGSGYQAAVLAELVKAVYTIEIIPPLAKSATLRLEQLGYDNVTTRIADGYYGWQEHAPFDAIVVTAAASHIPPPLIKQLKPGARMIIPVGSFFFTQQLTIVEKNPDGAVITRQILPVAFVPLTGKH
jgi:protein-L-isoaspartate(D-aspartate) O-methyltransferase